MTTHELAKQLLEMPNIMVTVRGYEGGVDEVKSISEPTPIHLNVNEEWYYGKHEYHLERGVVAHPENIPSTLAINIVG